MKSKYITFKWADMGALRNSFWAWMGGMILLFAVLYAQGYLLNKEMAPRIAKQQFAQGLVALTKSSGENAEIKPLSAEDLASLFDTCTSTRTAIRSMTLTKEDPLTAVTGDLVRACASFGEMHSKHALTYKSVSDLAGPIGKRYSAIELARNYGDLDAKVSGMATWK